MAADYPPGPGQTVTNGSWGGQNQGLRARLGFGTGPAPQPTPAPVPIPRPVPGYVGGIFEVPQSAAQPVAQPVAQPQATSSEGASPWQSGSVDESRLATLAPMLQGMMRSANGAMPAPTDAVTSIAPTDPATISRAAKLATGPSPVASLYSGVFGDRNTQAALDTQHAAASVLGRPDAQGYLIQHPEMLAAAEKDPSGFATRLKPMLDAVSDVASTHAVHQLPGGRTLVVPHDEPATTARVNAVAKATGADPNDVHAFTNSGKYNDEDLTHIIANMPSAMVEKLWGMQHYLTPQQQMAPQYLQTMGQQAASAKDAYDKAVTAGTLPKAELDKLLATKNAATDQFMGVWGKMALQQMYMMPQMQQMAPQ